METWLRPYRVCLIRPGCSIVIRLIPRFGNPLTVHHASGNPRFGSWFLYILTRDTLTTGKRCCQFTKVGRIHGSGTTLDSAEKVFFRKSEKNISHTDALYRTIGAWLIIFFIPNFRE
jgi:hypothetical protein